MSEPKTDRPTGTIFELDLFRERLDKWSGEIWNGKGELDRSELSNEIENRAGELKALIDNCQAQYVHTATPESDGAAELHTEAVDLIRCLVMDTVDGSPGCDKLVGECDCSINRAWAWLGKHYPADSDFGPNPSPPTPEELDDLDKHFEGVTEEMVGAALAFPPIEGGAEGPEQFHIHSAELGENNTPAILFPHRSTTIATYSDIEKAERSARQINEWIDAAYATGHRKGEWEGLRKAQQEYAAGASTRGSGAAAELLRVAELAENYDYSSVNEGEALEEVARFARRLAAQNPSRGSDGLREAAKKIRLIAAGLGGAKTADLEDARAYAESAAADLLNLAAHLDQHNRKDGE